jgi:Zn-dependent peptidase ImmA (M78 family)
MGLRPDAPLDIRDLVRHLNVEIIRADSLVDRARLEELERVQPGAFSAATFHLPDGRTVSVCNPCNDPARTNSDIGHELAHILLDHDVREIQQLAGHTFLTCNPEQEEEATWLAGCLLLPRPLLLREAIAGSSPDSLAARYQVSATMARFRLNTSGVLLQARRARTARGTVGR